MRGSIIFGASRAISRRNSEVEGREALIVDPPRHTVHYLETVDAAGARVVAIADTHAHADYISGGPTLALALDVPYYLNPADAIYPYDGTEGRIRYEPAVEGQTIRVGSAELTVVHTPGHTEGSNCYLLDGHAALQQVGHQHAGVLQQGLQVGARLLVVDYRVGEAKESRIDALQPTGRLGQQRCEMLGLLQVFAVVHGS